MLPELAFFLLDVTSTVPAASAAKKVPVPKHAKHDIELCIVP